MSAPPFIIAFSDESQRIIQAIEDDRSQQVKFKKITKAIRLLSEVGPQHPGLNSHKYSSFHGPGGEDVWESYVENRTPGAWRIWWWFGPSKDEITILTVGPHPD